MTDRELYTLLNERRVTSLIEIYQGNLQDTFARFIQENLGDTGIRYERTNDHRITKRYITCSYWHETLREVITDIENEHPVNVAIIPTEDENYIFTLEYRKEVGADVGKHALSDADIFRIMHLSGFGKREIAWGLAGGDIKSLEGVSPSGKDDPNPKQTSACNN